MLVPMICPKKTVRGKNTPSNISWQELKDPLHKKKKEEEEERKGTAAWRLMRPQTW